MALSEPQPQTPDCEKPETRSQPLSRKPESLPAADPHPKAVTLNGRLLDGYHDPCGGGGVDRLAFHYRRRLANGDASGDQPIPQGHGLGDPARLEAIIGANNLLPFDFLRTGDRLGRAVVKILRGDGAAGTGFLVAPGVLLTNHHVLPDVTTAATATATANYEPHPPSDPAGRVTIVPLRPAELFVTDAELDFTFCGVRGLDYLGSIPPDRNGLGILPHESVNIIQHPRGGTKRVALHDNHVEQADRVVIRYACDTEPGSSGSPVFNNEWRLVALHHASVEVEEGRSGRPPRYLNEGIRLSAIGLWLDSDAANEAGRPDQIARLRGLFRGVDPRVGLFGGLGRRPRPSRSSAQLVVDCHTPDPDVLDLAYWDLGAGAEPSPARLESLAWVVADLGVDLWCLAGLDQEAAGQLVEHLDHHLGLEYQIHALPGGLTLLCRRLRRLSIEVGAASGAFGSTPIMVVVRLGDLTDRRLRLVLAAPTPPAGRRVRVPGLASAGQAGSAQVAGWLGGLIDAVQEPAGLDALVIGTDAPVAADALAAFERIGLVVRGAATGSDGGCVLAGAGTVRVERMIVSGNLVPVMGGPAEVSSAVDRELPLGVRRVAGREPLAVRLVFGAPRPSEPEARPAASAVPASPVAPLERVLASVLAPLLARYLAELVSGLRGPSDREPGV